MKRCSICQQFFPATTEFFYSSQGILRYQCKECIKAQRRAQKERNTEYMRHYRQTPKNKAYQKKRNAEYNQTHKEQIRAQQNQHYQDHHDEIREKRNAFGRTEQGRLIGKAHKHKRKAQKRASTGSYTAQQLQEQLKRQKGMCYYCNVKLGKTWHPDHVVPLARGGSNDISNIVIACPTCNMRKNDKLPHEWIDGGRLL